MNSHAQVRQARCTVGQALRGGSGSGWGRSPTQRLRVGHAAQEAECGEQACGRGKPELAEWPKQGSWILGVGSEATGQGANGWVREG